MKKLLLIIACFMLLSSFVLAECQYKEYVEGDKTVSNLYINGIKQENVLLVANTWVYTNAGTGETNSGFEVFNNIDYPVNARVEFLYGTSTNFENVVIPAHGFVAVGRYGWSETPYIDFNTIKLSFQSNEYTEARWEKELIETCKQCLGVDCLNDGSMCSQDFECGSGICNAGFCDNGRIDFEERISALESWKTAIESWKESIISAISDLWEAITSHEKRIQSLENTTTINYFQYLSSSNREDIVCNYAKANNLTSFEDLGYSCNITYKTSRTGKVTSTCKCASI